MLQRRNLLKFWDESTFACWGEHHIGSFRGFCTGDPRPWEKRRGCLSAGKQLDYDFFRHSRTIDGALFYLASAKTPLHAKGPNKALKSSFANSVKSHCACASLCGGIGKGAGWEGSLGREQDGKKPRPWRTNLRIDGRNAPQIVFPNRLTKSCYPFNSRVSITNQSDVKTRQVYRRVPIMTAFDMRPKDSAQWWQSWTVLALVSQTDGSSEDVRNHECWKARGDS